MSATPDVPLKHLAELNPETLGEDTDPERVFRYVDIGVVGRGTLTENPSQLAFEDAPSRARRVLRPGDTVVSTVRTYLRAVWTAPDEAEDFVASTGFVCLRPRSGVSPGYLAWLAQSDALVEQIVANSVGVSYPAIAPSQVGLIKVPCPALARQRAISTYLNCESSRVDALIATRQRMVKLLAERWQAVLSEATRARLAIIPAPSMPDRWTLMALKRCLASAVYGIGEASQADGEYAVIGMSNIRNGEVVGPPGGFVDAVHPSMLLAPGDLLFNRTNSRELVGKVGLVRSLDCPTTFASYLVRLRVNQRADARYLNYLLNTKEILGLARSMALPSIGQANLNPSRYADMVLPIPPVEEQREFVLRLDALASRTAAVAQMLQRQIQLLGERRQALITAAITGEFDVPEAA